MEICKQHSFALPCYVSASVRQFHFCYHSKEVTLSFEVRTGPSVHCTVKTDAGRAGRQR